LVLEPRFLDYGFYKIELVLTLNGVEGIFESTEGFLQITQTPLSAVIIQGSAIRRGWNEPIRLDGSESYDPDKIEKSESRLIFRWFCYDINKTIEDYNKSPLTSLKKNTTSQNITDRISCGRYRASFVGNVAKFVVLVPELLLGEKIILVELEIEEGNRMARTSTLVERVNSSVPWLKIR
jgi:hypothetical protein